MSIRDYLFGPNAATGSVDTPARAELGATRREAVPTSFGAGESSSAVGRLLDREGGYSNDSADRGGKTNYGISSAAYPGLDVSSLTREQAAQIYKRDYWDAIGADQLDPSVREIAFDAAVNHGVGGAKRLLQEAGNDPDALLAARRRLYDKIVADDPSQAKFRAGWENRLNSLKTTGSYEERGSGIPEQADWRSQLPVPSDTPRQRSTAWTSIMEADIPQATPKGDTTWEDFGRGLGITAGDFVKAPVAALENVAGLLSDTEGDAGIYATALQNTTADVRRGIGAWQKDLFKGMTPEAIDRANRELLTLDPKKTMWQGGAQEFLSSMALKGTLSLGPTIGPMITTALLGRMGVGASASTLWGAQEGLMSAGLTAAQIADEIEQTPLDELRKVPRFKALEDQLGEVEAKRQYTNEVQGIVPAATGLLVGAISKGLGKPLDDIFGMGKGAGLLKRTAVGATAETLQEGPQSYIEQVMQNYAKMAYDSNVGILDGAAEQAVQGMLLGGVMGGTFAGLFGNRPQNESPRPSGDPVPGDIRAALEASTGGGATPGTPPGPAGGPSSAGFSGGAVPTDPLEAKAMEIARQVGTSRMQEVSAIYDELKAGVTPEAIIAAGGPFGAANYWAHEPEEPEEPGPPGPPGGPPPTSAIDEFNKWDPNAAPEQADPELVGDNVGADEVFIPPVEEKISPLPKNRAKVPKLADTYGIPEFQMEQEAEAQALAAAEAEANPLGLYGGVTEQAVPVDIEAALSASQPSKPRRGDVRWQENPKPVDLDAALSRDQARAAAKAKPLEPSSLPPMPEEQAGFDVNQSREPKHGIRTRTEMLGYRVRVRGANGELISSRLVDGKATAKILAKQAEKGLQPGQFVEMVPARRTFINERTPTAEPVSDLLAQIRSMQDSDALDLRADPDQRRAVYLTRESLDNLNEAGQLDQALRGGVPIRNFDTYGGILLARDAETAQEMMQLIEDPNSNIDEVIGYATGAGNGKPGGTNPVVQLLDGDGNVIRERQVTPEEAPIVKARWGSMARVMPLEQALTIRNNRMQREKTERAAAAQQQAFTATQPEQKVEELFSENPITREFAPQAKAKATEGGLEEDIGGRLLDLARETREKERTGTAPGVFRPADVQFRGRDVVLRSQEATRLRRAGKETEAKGIDKSIAGEEPQRAKLNTAYEELYAKVQETGARLNEIDLAEVVPGSKSYSVQDRAKAEQAYEQALSELKAFFEVEGGYTKSEAIARAATRYSPKARKQALHKAAREREAAREKADKADEDKMETRRAEREEYAKSGSKNERIIARGDEAREQVKLDRIKQGEQVSVETVASKLKGIAKRKSREAEVLKRTAARLKAKGAPPATIKARMDWLRTQFGTPEGQRMVESLFMFLSPSIGADLDQLVDAKYKSKERNEQLRTETAKALIEINQLLRQWLTDYRLALMETVNVDKETKAFNAVVAVRATEVAEALGNLRAYHQNDISIADDAARVLAYRISTFVIHGKRRGVGTEMDIDGFWGAIKKGPLAFRDYLSDTVQAREDLPFPTDLTEESLQGTTLGTLNALYVKALEFLDGSRESDGRRRALVKAIKKAAADRGLKLSDTPEKITIEVWNRKAHEWDTIERTISPRKLFAETFRRSYGIRGADSRMSMEQLSDLYLRGGGMRVWNNGWVEFEKDDSEPMRRWRVVDSSVKGKPKVVKIEPLGDKLPEPVPLNVRARRVTPEKKRKVIMSAVRAMDRKRYGGKAQSTGLARTAKSKHSKTRAATKYNVGVLLEDTSPRDLGSRSIEYEERKASAKADLSEALSNTEKYLAQMDTAKYRNAVDNMQGYVHAKAYIRWVYEYGTSLSMANLKSWAAFQEMNRVTVDLNEMVELNPEEVVGAIDAKFTAEMNEQIFRTVKLDPVKLEGLSNPKRRAEMTAESHDRLRKIVLFHRRLTEAWGKHPIFVKKIAPILNQISESLAVKHRGEYQEHGGWPLAKFTDKQRQEVVKILEEWRTARDEPQWYKLQLFNQWGFPASDKRDKSGRQTLKDLETWSANLYSDFYLPLHEMLSSAGFIDPDKALVKQFTGRYTPFEAGSTGPLRVQTTGYDGLTDIKITRYRATSIGKQDPAELAAAEVDARNQASIDKQLAALDEDELDEAEIVDRGRSRPLTEGDRIRRRKLIASPIGKTGTSAKKLLNANLAISRFQTVLYSETANIRQIARAEKSMLATLREYDLVSDGTEPGTLVLGIPDAAPIVKRLEEELKDLETAQAEIKRDPESTESLQNSKESAKAIRVAGEIQQTREELEALQAMQLGNKRAGRTVYTPLAERMTKGELTKEAARLEAVSMLPGFRVKKAKAERVGMVEAKTVGDQLKARAKKAAEEKTRRATDYDRHRGFGDLKLDISSLDGDYGKASGNEYEAFFAFRDMVDREQNGRQLGEVLTTVGAKLGNGHTYQPLIRLLTRYASHRRVPVIFTDSLDAETAGRVQLVGGAPVIALNVNFFTQAGLNPLRALHVLMHEAVHAATVGTMAESKALNDALDALRQIALQELGGSFQNATSDIYEFVAEAFSSAEFQRALKGIKTATMQSKYPTLWSQFVGWVRELLGLQPAMENMLDAVMSLTDQTFGPTPYSDRARRAIEKKSFDFKNEYAERLGNSAFAQNEMVQDAMKRATALGDNIKEGGQSFLLKALTMRQLAQFYSRYFGSGEASPFSRYMKAFENRNSYAAELLEEADKLSRRWTAIEEGKDGEGVELSRIMHDATVNGVHADEPGSSLYARYTALTPAAQQLYKDVRDYYKATQKLEVQLMLANALRASKLWKGGEIDAKSIDLEGVAKGDWLQQKLGLDIKAMKAKLAADEKTLDPKAYKARNADLENTVEELRLIARMASIPAMTEGPYFPLMRFGDYAVRAERTVATEVYATRKERSEAQDRWQEKDPTLQFSFTPTDDNTFPLVIKEVEFRLAETRTEIADARAEMVKIYGEDAVSRTQLKRNLISEDATIASNRALQTLLGKLDGNAAAQAAMREFYIKSLSDRSFRKREAKRKNIRGVDPTKQHRTFGAYSKSASYYTSQLKYGHIMADAKADMDKVKEAHRDESEITAIRMGQIVNEIKIRDEQAATLTDVSPIVRGAVETGQLWLLLSPSYWMINATQPWLVTTPWLAGHSDMPRAVRALTEAQALIVDPLVSKGVNSWGGLKAIKSRFAAEQAFTVLEDVEKAIKKKYGEQGKDPQPVLDMLTALKRESIIDLSFVAELRDVAQGEDKGRWGRVLDASRVLAHLTEVNNRIMTAVAAYNIAKGNGLSEKNATDFAKRAVAETQFDYSAANKARLFSANDAWWKPLVFQFMQYVQHMYVLFVRHAAMWWNAPRGSAEARLGRRVVLGLLASHMAAGGLLGATPQLAKWAIGLVMMAFGAGDDDDSTFKNLSSGEYYDRMMTDAVSWLLGDNKLSETVRAGLPRLAGFDLSSRMALLQTYMIDLDTKTSETLYGSLVSTFGGPMFGIAGNAFDAIQLAAQGDADKAWEKLLPKLGRDAVRASRFWQEGMVDNTGKTILRADELSPWEIFLTGIGFQPSQIAETYDRNNRARESEAFVSKQKAEIMAAYRKARSTGETDSVMDDLREFNKKHPMDRITMSQLLRSMRQMRKGELNIQRYGVDAGNRSNEYDDDSYNVE